jgi:CheY-like chemotaxis protein
MTGVHAEPRPVSGLWDVASAGSSVVLLGLEQVGDEAWEVLTASGLRFVHVADVTDVVRALTDHGSQVVLVDVARAPALIRALRADRELSGVHVVVCATSAELRPALDAGADDVMRIPFEPEVLAARVGAGLRAARLRAGEALLRSLVGNIPGAVYRCACDGDWTMLWLSDEIAEISGYPAADFIESRVRSLSASSTPTIASRSSGRSWTAWRRAGRSPSSTGSSAATASCGGCSSEGRRRTPATDAGGSTAPSST